MKRSTLVPQLVATVAVLVCPLLVSCVGDNTASDTRFAASEAQPAALQPEAAPSGAAPAETSRERIVFSGTVVKKTGAELQAPSGLGMPNGEDPGSQYILLELDTPQEFTEVRTGGAGSADGAGSAAGEHTNWVEYVLLGRRERTKYGSREEGLEWERCVGKHAEVTVAVGDAYFATDSSMPLNALRLKHYSDATIQ